MRWRRDFVLLDNFYDCAETSADGWNWSTAGMVSEYTARNAPFSYSGRGRGYDYEGSTNGVPKDLIGQPDVAGPPGGYLWDLCARHGISYRNYGCFSAFADVDSGDGKSIVRENGPTKRTLVGHSDLDYRRYDLDYADSDAWSIYGTRSPGQKLKYGRFDSRSRFAEWKREFDGFVATGEMPRFQIIRLPRDHTSGTQPDSPTPRAMVADNDYAVGQVIDALSHSRFWKQSAIFVLEDDAQDGDDHVDAHRSTCFIISPFVRRGACDHTFYNTDSVLKTMERLLQLPSMCQYDAIAPLLGVFGSRPENADPYTAILPPRQIIGEINLKTAYRAGDSARLDFSREDRVDEATLNDILWHSVKGAGTPEPPVRHTLLPNWSKN